jgi:DNA-binding transcriptional LysR family regulator
MTEIDADKLRSFLAVMEAGGFTAAARRLGLGKSRISADVAALEARLGTALLRRTTRQVLPTEAGEALARDAAQPLRELQEALDRAACAQRGLTGSLRLTAPADYSATVLAPLLATFARRHPGLRLDLVATDAVMDLVGEGLDLAIRTGELRDSALRQRGLGSFGQVAVAAPELLTRHEPAATPPQLEAWPWIVLSGLSSPLHWTFTAEQGGQAVPIRLAPAHRASTAQVVLQWARAGLGAAILPDFMVAADLAAGRLQRLLPGWRLPRAGNYAVFPATRHPPAKVAAMIDFLADALPGAGATGL